MEQGQWRSVRAGMIFVFAGLLALLVIDLVHNLLITATIQQLVSGDHPGPAETLLDRLDMFGKVFPFFECAALTVVLLGIIGLLRTPPPSPAPLLAVFALVGCAASLLLEGGLWVIRVVDDDSELLRDLSRGDAVWLAMVVAAQLTAVMLALAIQASGRRADRPVPLVLVVLILVLAGICLAGYGYLILGDPRWRWPDRHPWAWLFLRLSPALARNVLTALLAMILASRLTGMLPPRRPA